MSSQPGPAIAMWEMTKRMMPGEGHKVSAGMAAKGMSTMKETAARVKQRGRRVTSSL